MNWASKTVWITGASTGIGAALAEALARRGATLILSARRREALVQVAASCEGSERHLILPIDLTQSKELADIVATATAHTEHIDVLINNAGMSQRGTAIETTMEVDRHIMELNYFAVIALTKAVLPGMLQAGGGHIVTVSSLTGKISTRLRSAYAASKHALHGFMDALRAETYDDNIRVLVVCPGFVRTDISKAALTADGSAHAKMDDAQANGMPAPKCAQRIIRAIEQNKAEVLIAGKEKSVVYLKRWAPWAYHRLIRRIRAT